MNYRDKAAAFVKERDEVLRSLDLDRVIEFYDRYNPPWHRPSHRDVYEIMMHKVRFHLASFTEEERSFSQNWLITRGYTTDISTGLF